MSRPRQVMIMAGGTGGHIFPGLAVAEELKRHEVTVSWLGTRHGLENRLVPAAGLSLDRLTISGLRGRGLAGWLMAPLNVTRAMLQARQVFKRQRPGCVLSMGGYVAGPGGLMAWLMGIPLIIHEQNAIAGLTNRLLVRLARRIYTGFPGALPRSVVCGNPVRGEIAGLSAPGERMGRRDGPLRLLVIGGSQGALALNRTVPEALAGLPEASRPAVLHQAGSLADETRARYQALGVEARVDAFIDDMADAWSWADLAICRAGALTVAELAAAGVASILVPFPHAVDDHQTANARYLADAGAAWLIPQSELTPGLLAERLRDTDRNRLIEMAEQARRMSRHEAAAQVAAGCLEVIA